jgi:hypothetical protein
MKSGAGILAVTPGHHRQDAEATLSLKFPTQVSSLFFP